MKTNARSSALSKFMGLFRARPVPKPVAEKKLAPIDQIVAEAREMGRQDTTS